MAAKKDSTQANANKKQTAAEAGLDQSVADNVALIRQSMLELEENAENDSRESVNQPSLLMKKPRLDDDEESQLRIPTLSNVELRVDNIAQSASLISKTVECDESDEMGQPDGHTKKQVVWQLLNSYGYTTNESLGEISGKEICEFPLSPMSKGFLRQMVREAKLSEGLDINEQVQQLLGRNVATKLLPNNVIMKALSKNKKHVTPEVMIKPSGSPAVVICEWVEQMVQMLFAVAVVESGDLRSLCSKLATTLEYVISVIGLFKAKGPNIALDFDAAYRNNLHKAGTQWDSQHGLRSADSSREFFSALIQTNAVNQVQQAALSGKGRKGKGGGSLKATIVECRFKKDDCPFLSKGYCKYNHGSEE
jgi:hypothetical protein